MSGGDGVVGRNRNKARLWRVKSHRTCLCRLWQDFLIN